MDFSKRIQALKLRKEGKSYLEIKKLINVSKSTLSNWLKDIELSSEQKNRLNKLQATAYLGAKKRQSACLEHHSKIKEKAKEEAKLLFSNSFFIAGLMLYWAEGNKRMGSVQFSNSDPEMISIMMQWFREFCSIPADKFRIGLIIHSLHNEKKCMDFWHKITSVPLSQFHRPYIKPSIFNERKNLLYERTCKIIIHNRDLLSKISGWKEGIKEIFLRSNYPEFCLPAVRQNLGL